MKKSTLSKSFATASLIALALLNSGSAFATTGGSDFDTAGDLSAKYEVWSADPSNFAQGTDCGLSNSGCVVTDGSSPTLARQLSGVEFPSVGNSISTFVYFKASDNNGYATLGFTGIASMDDSNTSGTPMNPDDAISFNAHGGGYVLLSAQDEVLNQGWDSTSGVTNAHTFADIVNQGEGKWFKESITLTRVDSINVDVNFKVEEVNDDATTYSDGSYWAEFTANDVDAEALANSGTVYPFFGNSDPRATNFDNAGVEVADVAATSSLANTGGNEYLLSVLGGSLISLGLVSVFASRRKQLK